MIKYAFKIKTSKMSMRLLNINLYLLSKFCKKAISTLSLFVKKYPIKQSIYIDSVVFLIYHFQKSFELLLMIDCLDYIIKDVGLQLPQLNQSWKKVENICMKSFAWLKNTRLQTRIINIMYHLIKDYTENITIVWIQRKYKHCTVVYIHDRVW